MKKASKVVISFEDYLFLQHRDNKKFINYPNKWSFFGGRKEISESTIAGTFFTFCFQEAEI